MEAEISDSIIASYRAKSIIRMIIGMGTPSSQSKIPRPIETSRNVKRYLTMSLEGFCSANSPSDY